VRDPGDVSASFFGGSALIPRSSMLKEWAWNRWGG
jgi:hypothetical protein